MKRLAVLALLALTGCGESGSDGSSEPVASAQAEGSAPGDAQGEVSVTMEGQTLVVPKVDWQVSTVEEVDGERRYMLMAQDKPLTLNLNVRLDAIPAALPATFTLPDANNPEVTIDLNFFNQDRDSKRMQKRIIFSQGTIDVRAMGADTLEISFEGQGHPLMKSDSFPIQGTVSVSR
ncbi:MAG: hypothetical protein KDE55_05930 [Novosphingobium sp.]|nr:hypothetical protein [Novosphingobium sp.]